MGALRSNASLIALGVAIVVGGGLYARHLLSARASRLALAGPSGAASGSAQTVTLRVPHMPGGITLDGDTDDPGWLAPPGPARTGPFLFANGAPARPYSESRLVCGDGYLYLCLYAADEDIESRTDVADGPLWLDDAFRVTFTQPGVEYAIEVSPKAVVTDSIRKGQGKWDYSWQSDVHVSRELDGTVNQPKDLDEEWVIEMALPFESIGLQGEPGESIGFSVRRCDTPKGETRVCASWASEATPGRLVLTN
jgi:hypothetical protein